MEDRAPVVPASELSSTSTTITSARRHEGRGAWVLTCYGICGLALFGAIAYFVADFVSH